MIDHGPRHFIGYCNGALTKKQCAFFNRKRGHPITIPVEQNGVIFTGKQPDGLNLTVIDLDVEPGKTIPNDMLDLPSKCTFAVRSGKGGLHLYFYTETEITSTQRTPSKLPGISNVDRRGKGGIIFAPGCRFEKKGVHQDRLLSCKDRCRVPSFPRGSMPSLRAASKASISPMKKGGSWLRS